ncbi:MAG: hypothetical protein GC153_09045 [Alphaproteobacteria bacterium]|nr:hypothetical protein [Alphaproteobacteria bacterium]
MKALRRGGFGIAAAACITPTIACASPLVEVERAARSLSGGAVPALAGAAIVVALMGLVTGSILTSRRMAGSSLFNRLFVVVAVTAGFFSAVSSAIGYSLITAQESQDFFRNNVLPPAFGVFVFFLAVAIWVGGAELVRERDWFRGVRKGLLADLLFFVERAIKLFVVIPILALILFFVSTWTTVVGIGGVDAVRYTYTFELARLQSECDGITAYRQKDKLFLEDLKQSVRNVRRTADSERIGGTQSGAAGAGAVAAYYSRVALWLDELQKSVETMINGPDPSGVSPYTPEICSATIAKMKTDLAGDAFSNYDAWQRKFETEFNDFAGVLNQWRHDQRIVVYLDGQLDNFDVANPRPVRDVEGRLSDGQSRAINQYAEEVKSGLETLVRRQKLAKPPPPLKSAAELSPARGLNIFLSWFRKPQPVKEESVSRTAAVVAAEFVPGLSTITPRDAVLKNANIFSDVWALAIAWDYAAYILMLAYLFFPSAERAAGYKD